MQVSGERVTFETNDSVLNINMKKPNYASLLSLCTKLIENMCQSA